MTPLDLSPRPGAAPAGRQVRAQAVMETRLLLRNGEQLLLALVIPVLVLVGCVLGADRIDLGLDAPPVDVFTPGVLALAVLSTSFTSLAIGTGFERRYGVIKRLGASPLPRWGLLAGKVGALLVVETLQVVLISAVGFALGWQPDPHVLGAALAVLAGTAAFASLGLLMAGVLRAEATLAAANLVYLLLLTAGAVVLPSSSYEGWGEVARWLPSGALGDAMRLSLITARSPGPAGLPARVGGGRRPADRADVPMGVSRWLRALAWATLAANVVLVVTGGAVRLTGSGLGCPTWPRCTDRSYTPHGALDVHEAIEFGNRTLTFVLVAIAVATLVAAWRTGRRDLRILALILALGIPGPGGDRRHHRADRPQPLGGVLPPAVLVGHHRAGRAVPAPPRPSRRRPRGSRPGRRTRLADLCLGLAGALHRHGRHRLGSARRRRRRRPQRSGPARRR